MVIFIGNNFEVPRGTSPKFKVVGDIAISGATTHETVLLHVPVTLPATQLEVEPFKLKLFSVPFNPLPLASGTDVTTALFPLAIPSLNL